MKIDEIAVLIPCYNEELTIKDTILEVRKYLPQATIYVYDNNSTDKTVEIASSMGVVIRHEPNQGKGNVVRTMFKEIDAKCYVLLDGDNTYLLDKVDFMVNEILNNNVDMCIGDRLHGAYFKENKKKLNSFGNSLVRFLVNLGFDANDPDIMTGLRTFSYPFVKSFPFKSNGFTMETEISIYSAIHEIKTSSTVITYQDRIEGSSSKLNTFKDGFRVLKLIFKNIFIYKPMIIFGILFTIFAIFSLGFLIPSLITNLNRLDYFIVGMVFLGLTIINIILGLILNKIAKNKINKENKIIKLNKDKYKDLLKE